MPRNRLSPTTELPEDEKMGKRCKLVAVSMLVLSAVNGCSSMNHTETGALSGGLIGAGIGALAGGRHNAGAGAAVGGLVGTGVGALAGHSADEQDKRDKEAAAAAAAAASAPVRGPLSLEEIVQMSKAGVGDPLIINQIHASHTRYNLNADTIIWLQQNNVSNAVITEM